MTIKISHRELEACRKDINAWVRDKKEGGPAYFQYGYDRYLRDAIQAMHRAGGSAERSKEKLAASLEGNPKLKNDARKQESAERFDSYVDWFEASGLDVAEARVRLGFPRDGEVQLVGVVGRVDVMPNGYLRAVLLGDPPEDWRTELRSPLIQAAVAEQYGYPVDEVQVGWQSLDGESLDSESFGVESITEAEAEFRDICERIQAEWGSD